MAFRFPPVAATDAGSDLDSDVMNPTTKQDVAGEERTTKSKVLETGAALTQVRALIFPARTGTSTVD